MSTLKKIDERAVGSLKGKTLKCVASKRRYFTKDKEYLVQEIGLDGKTFFVNDDDGDLVAIDEYYDFKIISTNSTKEESTFTPTRKPLTPAQAKKLGKALRKQYNDLEAAVNEATEQGLEVSLGEISIAYQYPREEF